MNDDKITINDTKSLLKNEYYKRFYEKKQELKSKYPQEIWSSVSDSKTYNIKRNTAEYITEYRKLHQEYLKELATLIFEPEGDYQQFTWDIMGETEKVMMERKSRGRKKPGRTIKEEEYE